MKMDIILQLSLRSIRLHFLRSVLAALGIVIGVVAISSMGMMGANMTMSVTEQLSAMANVLVVRADTGGGAGPGPGCMAPAAGGGVRPGTGGVPAGARAAGLLVLPARGARAGIEGNAGMDDAPGLAVRAGATVKGTG